MKIAGVTIQGGGGEPGGSDTHVQYNSGSVFGGIPTLTYDGTTLRATGSFTGSFSGSLLGTASNATSALSSSFSATASFATVALSSINQTDLPTTIVMSFNNFR